MDFEIIWETYERELSSFVLSRVRDKEIQKEIMQEVALKIFVSLHKQKKHLRGWLYTITKNCINDYYRTQNRPKAEIEEPTEESEHIVSECLYPMLDKLKPHEKEILQSIQLQGFSLKEVATQKGLSHAAVKSRLLRAKQSLASVLFSCCEYEKNSQGDVVDFKDKDGCKC